MGAGRIGRATLEEICGVRETFVFPSLLLQEADARLSVTVNQHALAPLVAEGRRSIEESQPDRERQDNESRAKAPSERASAKLAGSMSRIFPLAALVTEVSRNNNGMFEFPDIF